MIQVRSRELTSLWQTLGRFSTLTFLKLTETQLPETITPPEAHQKIRQPPRRTPHTAFCTLRTEL